MNDEQVEDELSCLREANDRLRSALEWFANPRHGKTILSIGASIPRI